MSTPRLLVPLVDAVDERSAGGKASSLARLIAMGMPVPDGVVLTCEAFHIWLDNPAVSSFVDAQLDSMANGDHQDLERAAAHIRAFVMAAPLPSAVEDALRLIAASPLGRATMAVRSSAVGEDGRRSSFAGLFDSVLGVTPETLAPAVRSCWASYWSARAVFYRQARRVDASGMAVVIQRQVDAAAAGVLFTRTPDPTSSASDEELIVEYASGLADKLVAGEIDPGRLFVSRSSLTVTREVAGAETTDARRLLTDERIRTLSSLALRIEHAAQQAQDVEWAVDRTGAAAIVQARGVTTGVASRTGAGDAPGGTTLPTARPPAVLWSNANVNENFPEPISPLLYSIAAAGYYHYFRNLGLAFGVSRARLAAMDGALRAIVGVHGARLYYNLTNIHAVLRMAPFGDRLAGAFNLFVGAHQRAAQPDAAARWQDGSRGRQALELIRIVCAVAWQYLLLGRRLRAFERDAARFARRTSHDALRHRSLGELGADLTAFVDLRCNRWKNASLCDAAAMVCYALLRRLLARHGFGDATHTRLLRALPGVPSSQPALRLWALARLVAASPDLRSLFLEQPAADVLATLRTTPQFDPFRRELDDFLIEWGFRSSGELMLTTPTLDEQPEPVIALIAQYASASSTSPDEAMARQARERRAETRAVLTAQGRRAPASALLTWLLLRWTQRAVAYRERARLKQALLYTRCRRVALRIGDELCRIGWLRQRDDVFMLTWQEIDELCAGRAMLPRAVGDLVSMRHAAHERERRLDPPDTFEWPEGRAFERAASDQSATAGEAARSPSRAQVDVLRGATACGGWVSAPAAVLSGVHEAGRVRSGNVLVTRQTDPGWAPVFCLIGGLIIERGGMLSHGAIIAREFGLPCIVGVKNATTLIPHGASVTVDADAGTCLVGARP